MCTWDICANELVLCMPDVFKPNKHVKVQSSSLLEFKPVEKCFNILIAGNFVVAKEMFSPLFSRASTQIASYNLL